MTRWRRTHTCGELRDSHVGQTVTLNGWVHTYRSYNDQLFIDLRDRYGITQVVFEADRKDLFEAAAELRSEFVLAVRGVVRERLPGKHNPKLDTGDIEVEAGGNHTSRALARCRFEDYTTAGRSQHGNEILRRRSRNLLRILSAAHFKIVERFQHILRLSDSG